MGDFTGFSFGNWHSTDPDTGIVTVHRVSGGDRYTEQLHPEIKDKTAEVPELNGNYYFGSDFGPTTIDVEIAFDHLTEKQFRDLRKAFGTKEIQPLIFDERPYKKYMAKIESPVELSYICFDERIRQQFSEINNVGILNPETGWPTPGQQGTLVPLPDGVRMVDDGQGNRVRQRVNPWVYSDGTERIYKGEGKITFICYFPFAKSNFKVLPEAGQKYYEEREKWANSSGILSASQYQNVDKYASNKIIVYNAGDVATGFRLYRPFSSNRSTSAMTFTYTHQQDSFQAILTTKTFNAKICGYDDENNPIYDIGFLIDTNTGLITGIQPQTVLAGTIIYNSKGQIIETTQTDKQVGIKYDENRNASYFTSGNLYNEYVSGGYFFKLEPDDSFNTVTLDTNSKIVTTNGVNGIEIFYDYLYF